MVGVRLQVGEATTAHTRFLLLGTEVVLYAYHVCWSNVRGEIFQLGKPFIQRVSVWVVT
jgi:hypothetical protein